MDAEEVERTRWYEIQEHDGDPEWDDWVEVVSRDHLADIRAHQRKHGMSGERYRIVRVTQIKEVVE